MAEQSSIEELIALGKVSGVFGVKGWVKVHSYTDPMEKIVEYSNLMVKHQGQWQEVKPEGGKRQGKTVVIKLIGVDDRNEAELYIGDEIAIRQQQLEQLTEGEYYWRQLEGLDVQTTDGVELGKVHHLLETGANDVLVVRDANEGEKERLIPFTIGHTVVEVDLSAQRITVDWDPEF
jgi:16S rRNA processing protein RimM